MKKIIAITLALAVCCTSFAQTTAQNMTASNGLPRDTVSNTGVETWTLKVPGFQKTISAQIEATKISGTVAGNIVLLGSNTGTLYDTVVNAPVKVAADAATFSRIFAIDNSKYLYYRIQWTGTGTMSAWARCYLIARP